MIPELSIVAPATGGLPVAYGVCEALQAKQVYWAERNGRQHSSQPLRFRQYIEPQPGEQVVLVDDILRSGDKPERNEDAAEEHGAIVVALAVVIYQPKPRDPRFRRPAASTPRPAGGQLLRGCGFLRTVQERHNRSKKSGS